MTIEEWQRSRVELEARYQQINGLWGDTNLPALIRDTPGWERGHQLLVDWYDGRQGLPTGRVAEPYFHDTWDKVVHIMSHVLCSKGHSDEHAAMEEEGTRLIIEWWRKESA
jgi:hypothetical protein